MNPHYDNHMDIPPLDQYDGRYAIYDQNSRAFQGMPGIQMPYEGHAFWYRPEPQEPIYHQDASHFNPGMPLPAPPVADQAATVKHRRTRSGCFTCRNRRVKCDETRPVCDRCRKGNRECEFPQTTSSSKRAKTGEHKSAVEDEAEKDEEKLGTIKDQSDEDDDKDIKDERTGEEEQRRPSASAAKSSRPSLVRVRTKSLQSALRSTRHRQESNASATVPEKASSPSSYTSDVETPQSSTEIESANLSQRWKQANPNLKPEVLKYLLFQHQHMTYYHYLFKLDPEDFVHIELIDLALQFEPLLYAVVAFAAYHHTLRLSDSEADFNSFWKYYCKSIVKLRKWLEVNHERDDLVLLTVLQLAMFEEFLGDWTNLATHHRAAHGILMTKYTPQSIMESVRGRRIFEWYTHFDVISALMAVSDTVLDRTWLAYATEWHEDQIKSVETPSILRMISYFGARIRLIGRDVAHVFATANMSLAMIEAGRQIEFSINTIVGQVNQIVDRLDALRREIEAIHHTSMTSADENIVLSDDDVFPASIPLFRGSSWPLNFIWIDWYGIMEMLKYQTHMAIQKAQVLRSENEGISPLEQQIRPKSLEDLGVYSQIQCSIYSAIKRSPTAPEGAILGCTASLGLSAVLLPRVPKYTMWARKQMALFEQTGYVWPPSVRKEMSQLWNAPEVEDWWLPNGEGKGKLLTDIRTVVSDRMRAVSEQMRRTGQDDGKTDLREIKGLFEKMNLGRRSSTETVANPLLASYTYIANAASMVSSPENSSTGSGSGFSPRTASAEIESGKPTSRGKQQNWAMASGNVAESPTTTSKSASNTRMSGIWEEEQ